MGFLGIFAFNMFILLLPLLGLNFLVCLLLLVTYFNFENLKKCTNDQPVTVFLIFRL